MAKDKGSKKDKAPKADAKAEKAAEREFKFGVEDIATKLDIKPASVRVQLRNKGVEKAGKSYGWNSKAELDEVIATLKAAKDDAGADAPKASKKDKKAAKDEPAADAKGGKKGKKDKKSK